MGTEKPLVAIGGRTLIARVAEAIAPCLEELVIVTNRPDLYGFLGHRMLEDAYVGQGPLAGMHAGLTQLGCAAALVVACDYPFLDARSIARIARENPAGGAVIPEIEGHLHPLCALYAAEVLPEITSCLSTGVLAVHALLDRIPQKILAQTELGGPAAARTFFNINSPDDLRRAEELLAETQSHG